MTHPNEGELTPEEQEILDKFLEEAYMSQPKDPNDLVFLVVPGGSTEISDVLEGLDDLKDFVNELNKDNKEADDATGVDTGEQSGDSTRSVEE